MSEQRHLEGLITRLADGGHIIEAGWIHLRYASLPLDAPEIQIREMRKAFFAGAQHLFASILTFLEPETEPTDNDLRRIEMISVELEAFTDALKREANGVSE